MRTNNLVALIDIFLIMVITLILVIAVMKTDDEKSITTRAEFVITVTWPDGNIDDVDSWLKDPMDNVCWYNVQSISLMNLDRDDIGDETDRVYISKDNVIEYPHNQELMTIRGCVPGEYVFNLHMYKKREKTPTTIEVRMDQINPKSEMVAFKEFVLHNMWEEIPALHFELSEYCAVTWLPLEYEKLAVAMQRNINYSGN